MVRFQSLGKTGRLRSSITGKGEHYGALEESRPGGLGLPLLGRIPPIPPDLRRGRKKSSKKK